MSREKSNHTIDALLARERREKALDLAKGVLFLLAVIAAFCFLALRMIAQGAAEEVQGTVVTTKHLQDDQSHTVNLVVRLDSGELIVIPLSGTIPMGSRVTIEKRKNGFGAALSGPKHLCHSHHVDTTLSRPDRDNSGKCQ